MLPPVERLRRVGLPLAATAAVRAAGAMVTEEPVCAVAVALLPKLPPLETVVQAVKEAVTAAIVCGGADRRPMAALPALRLALAALRLALPAEVGIDAFKDRGRAGAWQGGAELGRAEEADAGTDADDEPPPMVN